MAIAKLSQSQIASFVSLRLVNPEFAGTLRAALWTAIKAQFSIPAAHKLKVDVDDSTSPLYGVVIRKKTGLGYTESGVPVSVAVDPAPAAIPKAWFKMDLEAALDNTVDTNAFSDGDVDDPAPDVQATVVDDTPVKLTADAVYVQLQKNHFYGA